MNIRTRKHVEQIGRFAWVGFLLIAAPCAIFCATALVTLVPRLFVEDVGVIESLPRSMMEAGLAWVGLVGHPVLWIASILFAYRFNEGWKAVVPFVLNLAPVVGMWWTVRIVDIADGQNSGWVIGYLGALAAALVVGLIAAVISLCVPSRSSSVRHV